MLNENIKAIRKSKGLSQQELAVKVNVVRQTVSKWEQGLSVPDSDLLIALSEALETPVSTLLGETVRSRRRTRSRPSRKSWRSSICSLPGGRPCGARSSIGCLSRCAWASWP